MGEFPQGEFPPQGDGGATADAGNSGGEPSFETGGAAGGGSEGEPGFETGGGAGGLPDMSDEPSFEDVLAGMEDAMGDGQGSGGDGQQQGQGTESGGYGSQAGTGAQAGDGSQAGGGTPSGSGNFPGGGSGGGQGPLTPAEQVAILDGQLERGTGEFDAMILEEQERQRDAARSGTAASSSEQAPGGGGSGSGDGYGRDMGGTGGGVARSGSYGGGIGGVGGGQDIPQNTAKYPPPEDIPDGNDDDVVARQLREAAMREPDPAVREKLWDEYRKYKGISP